jgi:hypothetical protein
VHNLSGPYIDNESNISLADIVEFIQESYKLLLGAGIVGAVLGLGSWFVFFNYKAELILGNKASFDFVSWRATERLLPKIASEMLEKKAVPDNQDALYKKISSPAWWNKNVKVNFAISEKDAILAANKDLKSVVASIESFLITAVAPSKAKALDEVHEVAQFISNGAAYIAINNLLNNYQNSSFAQAASIQQKISFAKIEVAYLKQSANSMVILQKSYPGVSNVSQQMMMDLKDDEKSKYLPLSTQIIAVNSDIIMKNQAIERLNDNLNQINTFKVFVEGVKPLMVGRYDGIAMIGDLLDFEENLRAKIAPGDIKMLQNLDALRFSLLNIKSTFSNQLIYIASPNATKIGILTATAGGIFVAGFLMLAFLLGRKALGSLKSSAKS